MLILMLFVIASRTGRWWISALTPVIIAGTIALHVWLQLRLLDGYTTEFMQIPYQLENKPPGYIVLPGDITRTGKSDEVINYYALELRGTRKEIRHLRTLPTAARIDLAGSEEEGLERPRFTVTRRVHIDLCPGMHVISGLEELDITLTRQ